ncbi:metallophosphoesterase [Stanieria cyanosphaera PCC 7437]|uniref:Metallophosphoesterase n=1 Tax=Stanieria cyanosphaera (strain ATCC 29371 / PCC 7437) TaxID=111780 RepID=K9XW98_STAC7|nr:metallophosphoesterase [Stanieria cyanosphaera]AFZ36865.1 metallophosphoesterase [Stanieria cyanosphaera PCC 7437]
MSNFPRRQLLIAIIGLVIAIAFATVNNLIAVKAVSDPKIKIVVISDLNSQYGSTTYEPEVHQAISLILKWQPDLVLCGGDMIAGQKLSLSTEQIKAMWAAFDRQIAQPLRDRSIPFGFTIGNHDGSGARSEGNQIFQRERKLASAYWNDSKYNYNLNFVDQAEFPFYYTFESQRIFFLVWDASTNVISPQQLSWVEQSLASNEAQQAMMRIAIGHLPLYPVAVGREKSGEYLEEAEKLRSLLEKYKVHTYISGHDHAYYPGKKGQLQLLNAGALGSGPRQLLNSNLPPRKTITIVEIDLSNSTTVYTTYDLQTLKIVDPVSLPPIIIAPNGKVLRRDLT